MKIRPPDMTDVGCPAGLERQEEAYVEALGESVGYELRGNRLEVQGEGGETSLVFKRREVRAANSAASGLPKRNAEMEGALSNPNPSVPRVEDCAEVPTLLPAAAPS